MANFLEAKKKGKLPFYSIDIGLAFDFTIHYKIFKKKKDNKSLT